MIVGAACKYRLYRNGATLKNRNVAVDGGGASINRFDFDAVLASRCRWGGIRGVVSGA
jgi:hypothetical protein